MVALSVIVSHSFAQVTGTSAADTTGTPTAGTPAVKGLGADTTIASAPTQSRPDGSATTVAPNSGLTVTGYLEAYYSHDFTAPKTNQERPGFLYNFRRNREVNVNLAFIKGAYVGERVRGNLAIQAGTYAQYNYAAEQDLVKNIFEANAGVKLSKTSDLWLDAGVFSSHIGFEGAIGKDNWTLTRSILAENSPYYLSGAKLTYNASNGKLTLLGSVINGWQRIKRLDGYSGPSVSTQVQYRPSPKLTLNWSSFVGSDRPDSLKQGRFFNNFYAYINPAGKFGVILGFDIGSDRKPVVSGDRRVGDGSYIWYSPVIIARFATSDKSYLNGRIEYYDDRDAVIIGIPGFRTTGYSLGYDYAILPNALFRIEGKIYNSKDAIFETDNGLSKTNTSLTTSLAISF
ncbi:porin [Spirosoma arcticum]